MTIICQMVQIDNYFSEEYDWSLDKIWPQGIRNGVRPDIRTFAMGSGRTFGHLGPRPKCPNVRPDPIANVRMSGLTPLRMPCGQILSKLQNMSENSFSAIKIG
jgi:hypothetical protein